MNGYISDVENSSSSSDYGNVNHPSLANNKSVNNTTQVHSNNGNRGKSGSIKRKKKYRKTTADLGQSRTVKANALTSTISRLRLGNN